MKRIIWRLTVASLVTGGLALAAAGPSSAARRDACMDQVNYWERATWLMDNAFDMDAIQWAWEQPVVTTDANGSPTYTVTLPGGQVVQEYTLGNYSYGLSRATLNAQGAHQAELSFVDSTSICP